MNLKETALKFGRKANDGKKPYKMWVYLTWLEQNKGSAEYNKWAIEYRDANPIQYQLYLSWNNQIFNGIVDQIKKLPISQQDDLYNKIESMDEWDRVHDRRFIVDTISLKMFNIYISSLKGRLGLN